MKSNLILKSISSSEVDLKNWYPLSNDEVFVSLDMEITFSESDSGTNLFYVTLATPEALKTHRKGLFLVKNRTLVIAEYDFQALRKGIIEIINSCSRDSWDESCRVLQRYFLWEFEDYVVES